MFLCQVNVLAIFLKLKFFKKRSRCEIAENYRYYPAQNFEKGDLNTCACFLNLID